MEKLELHTYRVRRWTAFEWQYPDDAKAAELRKDRESHLTRAAGIMERKLLEVCPRYDPAVKQVWIKREPQLMFELTIRAPDADEARRRAMYQIGRALSVKVPTGRRIPRRSMYRGSLTEQLVPERVALSPPWGEVEIERTDERKPRRRRSEAA
jgi:hypothetical protein